MASSDSSSDASSSEEHVEESRSMASSYSGSDASSSEEDVEEIRSMAPSSSGSDASSSEEDVNDYSSGELSPESPETTGTSPSAAAGPSKRRRSVLRAEQPKLDAALWSLLDDNLVEKIIAKLPFPQIFKAATLSKAWVENFRSETFQREVRVSASGWKSYTPFFSNKKEMVGFDKTSQFWHSLPTLSYLPTEASGWTLKNTSGSLMCWTSLQRKEKLPENEDGYTGFLVHISNPLTRSWRQLPARMDMRYPDAVHIVCRGDDAYQVILVSQIGFRGFPKCELWLQIFDSTSGSWSVHIHQTHTYLELRRNCSVFFNGTLYILGRRDGFRLVSFNVEDQIWEDFPYPVEMEDFALMGSQNQNPILQFQDVLFSQLVVCGSEVLLVVFHEDKPLTLLQFEFGCSDDEEEEDASLRGQPICVYKLNLVTGSASVIATAPPEMVRGEDYTRLGEGAFCMMSGDGNLLYIGGSRPSSRLMLYNLKTKDWEWVHRSMDRLRILGVNNFSEWLQAPMTYQPGLNPFLIV